MQLAHGRASSTLFSLKQLFLFGQLIFFWIEMPCKSNFWKPNPSHRNSRRVPSRARFLKHIKAPVVILYFLVAETNRGCWIMELLWKVFVDKVYSKIFISLTGSGSLIEIRFLLFQYVFEGLLCNVMLPNFYIIFDADGPFSRSSAGTQHVPYQKC